jgi:tRNA-2-methylthio-N6-dimethylallyladenosine synthase
MNDHDSERISGLLDADGLLAVEEEDDADVVVLNTCCIRENADNKLYGNLGMLKRWKDAREGGLGLPSPEGPRHCAKAGTVG